MRKITEAAVDAFFWRRKFSRGNTRVIVDEEGWTRMYLHGSCIAKRLGSRVELSDGGWQTSTTKERLNGILQRLGGQLRQHKFSWYWTRWTPGSEYPQWNEWYPGWNLVGPASDLERLAHVAKEVTDHD